MNIQLEPEKVQFDQQGLVPAIVQDASSGKVLTLAYMNRESLQRTLDSGETWFYSRSRQQLWHKGETSGHTQQVVSITYDCDQDAILVQVNRQGPACHTGSESCFVGVNEEKVGVNFLYQLEKTIAKREKERPEGAYTTYLFEQGIDKILKKVGEEAAEVIIAAKNRSHEELRYEAADLIYHLLVLLREQQMPLDTVLEELASRHKHT